MLHQGGPMSRQTTFAELVELLYNSFLEQFKGDEEAAAVATAAALQEFFLDPEPAPTSGALAFEKAA